MLFALVLFALFALLHLPPLRSRAGLRSAPERAAVAAGLFFVLAGLLHFLQPARYDAMIPPFLPAPRLWTLLSGAAQVLCGLGLLTPRFRRTAAWATVALLFAILPANIHVALTGGSVEGMPQSRGYYLARVPFQLLYVVWVAWAGGLLRGSNPGQVHHRRGAPGARQHQRLD
jgi:uncharacterized membrane protein